MESAQFAADVLVDALKSGDLSEEALKRYQDRWYAEWGPRVLLEHEDLPHAVSLPICWTPPPS